LESSLELFLWSIDRLGEMGYSNYGLEILEPQHTQLYRESGAIDKLLEKSRQTGVEFPSFTIWHCVTNLVSTQKDRRKLGVEQFGEGVEIAKELGIPVVVVGSDWPPEWVSKYTREYEHGPADDFFVTSREDYDHVWSGHREAISECLEIAGKHKIRLCLEPRANSLLSTADSFLRIWDELACEDLACVLDMAHCAVHRESVPVAIKKLGSRLGIIHICGTDGKTPSHLPLADDQGTRDILRTLAEIGFSGTIDVELYGMPVKTVDESYARAKEILERQLVS
jgi:sugar phosphate isomerase/epimerase